MKKCAVAAALLAVLAIGPSLSADLIRFGTYNLYNFGLSGQISETGANALAALMGDIDADIWAVQEIVDASLFEGFIHSRVGSEYDTLVVPGNAGIKVGVASRYPIVDYVNHKDDTAPDGQLYFSRNALEVTIRLGEQLVTVISTHLQSGYDRERRNLEGQGLVRIIQSLPPDRPVVLMGDFNDVFGGTYEPVVSPVNLVAEAGLTAVPARNAITRSTATFSSTYPIVRYDYIFMNAALYNRLTQHGVHTDGPTTAASDHLPVWAETEIEIVPEPASLGLWLALPVAAMAVRRRRRARRTA